MFQITFAKTLSELSNILVKNCFWTNSKRNGYSAQSEKAEEVVIKDKNNLKEKLEKWKTVMLSDVESDMHTEFHPRFFF